MFVKPNGALYATLVKIRMEFKFLEHLAPPAITSKVNSAIQKLCKHGYHRDNVTTNYFGSPTRVMCHVFTIALIKSCSLNALKLWTHFCQRIFNIIPQDPYLIITILSVFIQGLYFVSSCVINYPKMAMWLKRVVIIRVIFS